MAKSYIIECCSALDMWFVKVRGIALVLLLHWKANDIKGTLKDSGLMISSSG